MWLSEDEVEVWLAFALAGVGARVGAGLGFAGYLGEGRWAFGLWGGERRAAGGPFERDVRGRLTWGLEAR